MFVPGVDPGQPEGKVIGLGAGVDKEADGKALGHRGRQPLGQQDYLVMEEAAVGGQQRHLAAAGLNYVGVTVTNCGQRKNGYRKLRK